jgi:predicted nuclease of predicted toxin-antitoxin system
MRPRFLADADLDARIVAATARAEPSLDFMTANDAPLAGLRDPEVLARAAQEGRILVSHDRTTMPQHFGEFISSQNSPGVIIVYQGSSLRSTVERLVHVWLSTDASEWINVLRYFPR